MMTARLRWFLCLQKQIIITVLHKKIGLKDRLLQEHVETIKMLQRSDKIAELEREIDRWRQGWEHVAITFDCADRLTGEERRRTESWRLQVVDFEARIFAAWESDRRRFTSEADELRIRISDISEELAELQTKYDALNNFMTVGQKEFYAELGLLKKDFASTSIALDERTEELQDVTRKYEDTTQQLEQSEKQNVESTETIRQDHELIEKITGELRKSQEDFHAAEQQIVVLRAEIVLLEEGERFANEDVCSQQKERNEALGSYLVGLESKREQIEHLQKTMEEERDQFSNRIQSLKEEIATLRADSEVTIQLLKDELILLWRRFDMIDLTVPHVVPFMKTLPPLASDLDTNVICGCCSRRVVMTSSECFLGKTNTLSRPSTEQKMRARPTWH
eukprot:GEMP01031250.1.p1 GENE.GEMP01031250.1~~GEMP01031250.1.p1  ORF type:complete len:393 (+),score=75.46 GEMP01031250.1:232-1410(+)